MSLMSVGRLFQTSGPLTENARRLNCVLVRQTTADLVVDDQYYHFVVHNHSVSHSICCVCIFTDLEIHKRYLTITIEL